jgi:hypothetical protein
VAAAIPISYNLAPRLSTRVVAPLPDFSVYSTRFVR